MARTFRNRSTIPYGWVVRDDGHPYYNGDDRYGQATLNGRPRPLYRRSYYRCEVVEARRRWYRRYRVETNRLVREARWEDIVSPKRTSGWDSW